MDSPIAKTPAKQKIKKEGGDEFKIFGSQTEDCIVWGSPHDSSTCKLVYVPERTPTSSHLRSPESVSMVKKPSRRILTLPSEEPEYMLELAALADRVKMNAEKMKAGKVALETDFSLDEETGDVTEDNSNISVQNDPTNPQGIENDSKCLSIHKLDSNESLSDIFNDDADDFLLKCTTEIDEIYSAASSISDISESNMLGHTVKSLRQILPEKNAFTARRMSPRIKSRSLQNIRTDTEESYETPKTKVLKIENKFSKQSDSSMPTAFITNEYVVGSSLHWPATETKNINSGSISTVTNPNQILPDKNAFIIRRTSPRTKCRSLQNIKSGSNDCLETKVFVTRRTSPRTKFRSLQNIKTCSEDLYDIPETKVPKTENKFCKQLSSSVSSAFSTNDHIVGSHLAREGTQMNNNNLAYPSEAPDESLEAVLQSFVDEDLELLSQAFPECSYSSLPILDVQCRSETPSLVNKKSVILSSCRISTEYHNSYVDLNVERLRPNVSKSCNSLDEGFDKTAGIQTRRSLQRAMTSVNWKNEFNPISSESPIMTASQYVRCTAEQIERKRREAKLRLEKKRMRLQQTI